MRWNRCPCGGVLKKSIVLTWIFAWLQIAGAIFYTEALAVFAPIFWNRVPALPFCQLNSSSTCSRARSICSPFSPLSIHLWLKILRTIMYKIQSRETKQQFCRNWIYKCLGSDFPICCLLKRNMMVVEEFYVSDLAKASRQTNKNKN